MLLAVMTGVAGAKPHSYFVVRKIGESAGSIIHERTASASQLSRDCMSQATRAATHLN
jgi:hypothetical protein